MVTQHELWQSYYEFSTSEIINADDFTCLFLFVGNKIYQNYYYENDI